MTWGASNYEAPISSCLTTSLDEQMDMIWHEDVRKNCESVARCGSQNLHPDRIDNTWFSEDPTSR
jgi:hypothetical protein